MHHLSQVDFLLKRGPQPRRAYLKPVSMGVGGIRVEWGQRPSLQSSPLAMGTAWPRSTSHCAPRVLSPGWRERFPVPLSAWALQAVSLPTHWGMEGGVRSGPVLLYWSKACWGSAASSETHRLGGPVCFWPRSLLANNLVLACFSSSPAHPRSTRIPQWQQYYTALHSTVYNTHFWSFIHLRSTFLSWAHG